MRAAASRRDVVKAALLGTAGIALSGAACGPRPSGNLTVTELSDGLAMIGGAGGNVLAARGPDGLVLVDGGAAEFADDVLATAASAVGARDVAVLFNTHWHPEQTGLNDKLGRDGVRIIAHENTRLWLEQGVYRRWEDKTYAPFPAHALPNDTIYTTASLQLGDEQVDYGYLLQAHTDGDLYVFFRKANVLHTGGLVSGQGWSLVDWSTAGWIGGLVNGLTAVIALVDENTAVIPGDGTPVTKADLEAQLVMYTDIRDKLRLAWQASHGIEEVLTTDIAAPYADRGDPDLFLALAYKSWWGHVRELSVV